MVISQISPHSPSQGDSLHPALLRLFKQQGLGPEDIEESLSWDLKKLAPLTALKDLSKAAERIVKAMEEGQKVGIYGDYDVDGTTACALFYHFFQSCSHSPVELIQPSRFKEGYGLHLSSIDRAVELKIDLLITVDCGITNCEAADYARQRGLDLIITDHHKEKEGQRPLACAVVNPNRCDEPTDSPLKALAGVGVAFSLCLEIKNQLQAQGREIPSLYSLLPFVAIGTICDLVPLNSTNKKLVRHGLKQIQKTQHPGLKSFFSPEERRAPLIPSEKLSFQVGPLINSKGRLDHPEKALQLLTTHDPDSAFQYYQHLKICNEERKSIQASVFQEAKEQVLKSMNQKDHLISIVYKEDWHEGVIGIVASKLVEFFKVPALVFTNSQKEGLIKGSARTAGSLSLFDCLSECSSLFTQFGGHRAAAGMSLSPENLSPLTQKLKALLKEIPAIERTVCESFDLTLEPEEINARLVQDLELLEPFGAGNPRPIFKMKNFKIANYTILKEVHVRWNLISLAPSPRRLRGISFNYMNKFNVLSPQELFQIQNDQNNLTAYFTLGINRFKGNEYIQLQIERITTDDF